jgi:hypothetical protein
MTFFHNIQPGKYFVGGVDTFEHLLALNSCRRKTNRWPYNVFMFIVDDAAQNAFCLHNLINTSNSDPNRGELF